MNGDVEISISKTPAFTEIWYEGHVLYEGEEHKFWLIKPQNKDRSGEEYECEVRWFFNRVPRYVRALYPLIIKAFKEKNDRDASTLNPN